MADEQYEIYESGTAAALAEWQLDHLALNDGYYQQLTAGAADNLTGRGDATGGEYLFRTTAGTASVSDEGVATVKSIHGRTLAWNQHRAPSDGGTAGTINGITWAKNADGSITVSGTSTASTTTNIILKSLAAGEVPVGHKILIKGACPAGGGVDTYRAGVGGVSTDMGNGGIWTSNIRAATTFRFSVSAGATVPETTLWPQLFDLTAMFGAGNEPSTVAEFEALYPEPYYPYDAGSLLPVRMAGVETVGFNAYDGTTGTAKLLGGHQYQITGTYTSLSFETVGGETEVPALTSEGIFQTSANGTLTVTGGDAATTCVHLVWSGYRNGEYEPHWTAQRLIDAGTLRSAGSVYDELTETERITRVGEVDLGTLTWAYDSTNSMFYATLTGMMPAVRFDSILTCEAYESHPTDTVANLASGMPDKAISTRATYSILYAKDTAYTDAATFKQAMSGVMLHYALAEPTVTTYDPPINTDYRYADFGTERILVPAGTMSAPPTLMTVYGINATDTIRNLPTDYTSKKSLQNLLAALDAHNGTTTTMSWSEGQQAYTFAITDNESEG